MASGKGKYVINISGSPFFPSYYSAKGDPKGMCGDTETEQFDSVHSREKHGGLLPLKYCLSSGYDEKMLSIYDACKTVMAGDIILFSGKASTSRCIEAFCNSRWSHIAIVFYDPCIDKGHTPLLLESAASRDEANDVYLSTLVTGVRVVRMADCLRKYRGHCVSLRRLQMPSLSIRLQFNSYANDIIMKFKNENHGKPYEHRKYVFVFAKLGFCGPIYGDTCKSYFCSQLVAECYQRMGLLPCGTWSKRANQYLPNDFSVLGAPLPLIAPKTFFGQSSLGVEEQIDTSITTNSANISFQAEDFE
jgi:hypothetical protein